MVSQVLDARPDSLRGSVRLSATLPNGNVVITRTENRVTEVVRGGEFTVSTGGFVLEDPEPSFSVPLLYRTTLTIPTEAARYIQSNRVLNPKAAVNTANWTAGTGRTLTRVTDPAFAPPRDATTSLMISPNTGGATAGGVPERTLVSTVPSSFGAGRWYVSGQIRYESPDLWLWQEVRDRGTWQDIRDLGTWQTIKSSSSEMADQPFVTLWAAVLSPTNTTVVAPFQILGVQADAGDDWRNFSAWVDVPVSAPAGSKLVFLQGPVTREYAVTWWLSTVMVTPEIEVRTGSLLPYFDGDTPVPANPAQNMLPDTDWQTVSSDASIVWNGTANASVSIFTGPSQVTTTASAVLDRPPIRQIGHRLPVILSDPVSPMLGQWFELLEIGDLSYADRSELYDVVDRGPQVSVSSARAWPEGELRLLTRTRAQGDLAERLFATGRILFFRNPDVRFRLDHWYLHCGKISNGLLSPQMGYSAELIWRVPFVRVERPVGLIEASSTNVTWADIRNNFTWEQLLSEREDWLGTALVKP